MTDDALLFKAIREGQESLKSDFEAKLDSLSKRFDKLNEALMEAREKHVSRDELTGIRRELEARIDATSRERKADLEKIAERIDQKIDKSLAEALKPVIDKYSDIFARQMQIEDKQEENSRQHMSLVEQMSMLKTTLQQVTESQNKLSKIVLGNGGPSLPELVRESNKMAEEGLKSSRENAERLNQIIANSKRREMLLKDINAYGKALIENGQWISIAVGAVVTVVTTIQNYLSGIQQRDLILQASFWVAGAAVAALIFIRLQQAVRNGKGKNDHADST